MLSRLKKVATIHLINTHHCLLTSQNSSVNALLACNNESVDAALDVLQQKKKAQGLSAIHEDVPSSPRVSGTEPPYRENPSPLPHFDKRSQRRRSPDKVPYSSRYSSRPDGQYETGGISRISPITLPGFQTPINFVDLPPAPKDGGLPPPSYGSTAYDTDTHSDSSPTRTSPPYVHCSPPPYSTSPESKTVHVSPPPEVDSKSYSPYSYPIKSSSPYVYKPTPGYGTRITPPGEFSDSGIEEEVTPRRPSVPPEAFKFFIEQHIENVYKAYHQRQQRRLKLEQEMGKRKLDEATSEQMRRILYQKE